MTAREPEPVQGTTPHYDLHRLAEGSPNRRYVMIISVPEGLEDPVEQAAFAERLFGYKCDGRVDNTGLMEKGTMMLVTGNATLERPEIPLEEMTPEQRETADLAKAHIQAANFTARRDLIIPVEVNGEPFDASDLE